MTATLLKQFMTQTEFKTYRGVMHTSCDEVSPSNSVNSTVCIQKPAITMGSMSEIFIDKLFFFRKSGT